MCSADEFQVVDVDKLQRKKGASELFEGPAAAPAVQPSCSSAGLICGLQHWGAGCAKDAPCAPSAALLPPATCKDPPVPSAPSSTPRAGTEQTVLGANLSSQSTEKAALGFETWTVRNAPARDGHGAWACAAHTFQSFLNMLQRTTENNAQHDSGIHLRAGSEAWEVQWLLASRSLLTMLQSNKN